MKRRIIAAAVATVLLLSGLSGCRANTPMNPTGSGGTLDTTPTNPTGPDETVQLSAEKNAQNKYHLLVGWNWFQETDNFFCGRTCQSGKVLQYYDKGSGISGVLCADPSCAHDSHDCGAYVGDTQLLSYYDGSLYFIARDGTSLKEYLWKIDLSGMNREKIMEISRERILFPYQPQEYTIHQGKLYLLGKANTVTGTKAGTRLTLLAISLDNSEEITTLYDQVFEEAVGATVRFVGENVYLSVSSSPLDSFGPYDISVTRYGIIDGSTETLYEETGMTGYPGKLWVTEQGELYLPSYGENCGSYLWKLENGTRTEVIAYEDKGSYVYAMDGIVVNTTRDNGVRYIRVDSLTGEPVYEGKVFPEEIPGIEGDLNQYGFAMIGGDTEKLIIELLDNDSANGTDYTVMFDVKDNMKATVLWSEN